MIDSISSGIRVIVTPSFQGCYQTDDTIWNAFSYSISIENTGKHSVQLLSRFWLIKDSLFPTEIVEGEGVVGATPTLHPGSTFIYNSNVSLKSGIGAMKGHYTFRNLDNNRLIKARIPCFQLNSLFKLN